MSAVASPPALAPAPALEAWSSWVWLQRATVDRTKRSALRRLHLRPGGERSLVQLYLAAELEGEASGLAQLQETALPPWFREQMAAHLADEGRHVRLLRGLAAAMGLAQVERTLDPLSRRKLVALREAAAVAGDTFSAGPGVAQLAMGLVMEEMGVRFMARHSDVLREVEGSGSNRSRLGPVLESILADEVRHVAHFRDALQRLVPEPERPALEELLARLRAIDRRWSITGAVGLWLMAALGVGA